MADTTHDTEHLKGLSWPALLGGLVLLLALLPALFPWDWLRGPLNSYISQRSGRHFEITRHLDVKLGLTTRIVADGIVFANPDWAREPNLVKAESAVIDLRLLPLLRGRIEMPRLELRQPALGLQLEADGRRSWALGRDTSDLDNVPVIGALIVDEGTAHFIAAQHGADILTEIATQGAPLPMHFKSRGTWQHQPFSAEGSMGNVLNLSAPLLQPFPMDVRAVAGHTSVHATGTITSLATLEGADAVVNLQGQNLADLYRLIGVVMPATPRYALRAHLRKQGQVWRIQGIDGRLGASDLAGDATFDPSRTVPMLTGRLHSLAVDFDDLAPLVGLPEQPRSVAALPQVAGNVVADPTVASRVAGKVLPRGALDLARMNAMDADIHYSAARVTHVRQLPLESMEIHARLSGGVLQLDPVMLGVAGGQVAGRMGIDGTVNPARVRLHLAARSMEVNRLFPALKVTQASFGKAQGEIDLDGRGNSAAQMLAAASGHMALLMGTGQISNLFLEYVGLDGGEIIKFMLKGDRNVRIRCAAAAFDVAAGAMSSRSLLLDTDDTIIRGEGRVSLADETLDLTLHPIPKDRSLLALRSPLRVTGTFQAPHVAPDKGALAGRAGLAMALGAINPLLGLLATIETGPGKDADCTVALREAASRLR